MSLTASDEAGVSVPDKQTRQMATPPPLFLPLSLAIPKLGIETKHAAYNVKQIYITQRYTMYNSRSFKYNAKI